MTKYKITECKEIISKIEASTEEEYKNNYNKLKNLLKDPNFDVNHVDEEGLTLIDYIMQQITNTSLTFQVGTVKTDMIIISIGSDPTLEENSYFSDDYPLNKENNLLKIYKLFISDPHLTLNTSNFENILRSEERKLFHYAFKNSKITSEILQPCFENINLFKMLSSHLCSYEKYLTKFLPIRIINFLKNQNYTSETIPSTVSIEKHTFSKGLILLREYLKHKEKIENFFTITETLKLNILKNKASIVDDKNKEGIDFTTNKSLFLEKLSNTYKNLKLQIRDTNKEYLMKSDYHEVGIDSLPSNIKDRDYKSYEEFKALVIRNEKNELYNPFFYMKTICRSIKPQESNNLDDKVFDLPKLLPELISLIISFIEEDYVVFEVKNTEDTSKSDVKDLLLEVTGEVGAKEHDS